jgi:hypothetical protein
MDPEMFRPGNAVKSYTLYCKHPKAIRHQSKLRTMHGGYAVVELPGQNTHLDQGVQLLVTTNSQLQVTGCDTLHL